MRRHPAIFPLDDFLQSFLVARVDGRLLPAAADRDVELLGPGGGEGFRVHAHQHAVNAPALAGVRRADVAVGEMAEILGDRPAVAEPDVSRVVEPGHVVDRPVVQPVLASYILAVAGDPNGIADGEPEGSHCIKTVFCSRCR